MQWHGTIPFISTVLCIVQHKCKLMSTLMPFVPLAKIKSKRTIVLRLTNETPKYTKYLTNDKILKTRETEKRCSMGKRLANTFNIKKETQFCCQNRTKNESEHT